LQNNIKPSDILVVVGGDDSEKTFAINGINYAHVTHNSYDHTGLIYIIESNCQHPWWWSLHDTVEVGPSFYKTVLDRGPANPHISIGEEGWLNMGLFSLDFLTQSKNYILSLKDCSKMRAILSERMYTRLTQSGFYAPRCTYQMKDHKDIYGDGVIRRIIYYPGIDVYKYQGFYLEKQQTIDFLRGEEARYKFKSKLSI
jgi:hypothetical protein